MARIGIAGFLHETNTFAQGLTPLARFVEADAWPGLIEDAEIPAATRGMNLAISGFIQAMEKTGHTLVPLLWCSANPSGPVEQSAYDTVVASLERKLDQNQPLDALFLDLHGAMVTQNLEDGEGELLHRLRARLGADIPIVAALDFHANISDAMLKNADALVAYRSYPHVDMADTGQRACALLLRRLAGHPLFAAMRRAPFLIPMPWQSTLAEPARRLMANAQALQNDTVLEAQFIPGFPLADIRDSGPSVLVYAGNQEAADQAADRLHQEVMQAKPAFHGRLYSISDALTLPAPGQRLILADTQDNPGGGGSGDTTDLLHALLRNNVHQACAGIVCDPAFAAAAHAAGTDQTLTHALGGHSGVGAPSLVTSFTVVALGDGKFTGTGPFYLGCRMDLGPMARVRTQGLDIVVSSRKQQAADQAMFRHVGAEPADYKILVLKSTVHFRADFASLADDIRVVAAPGANTADLHTLHYRRLRPGVEIL
ncbi:M81 family metallopeptidase [Paralcaligenes ureilyticus]|uniref:Microcystinase C n=1 Tax=Paralcaligenes ureilyticus TaxID=627131 RepID=A0A4R3M1S7_9BURK|nr:M81 family metallopeptidase [Paralcaligenes ureilyticus]TCT07084.1 microcystin degradation protein MlrC [Paralcaligenes ureilyticus]